MSVINRTPPGLDEEGNLINDVVKAREEKLANKEETEK